MDELESKICFKRSVRILFKLYSFLGLVNFTYNRVTNRLERSARKECRFLCVLRYCGVSSLLISFFEVILIACIYYFMHAIKYIQSEAIILVLRITFMTINSFLFTMCYCRYKNLIIETLNQIIVLSERIERLTDGSLFYPGSFRKLIIIRLVLFIVTWFSIRTNGDMILNMMTWLPLIHCNMLMELTFWAQLYGNLTLMCFYQKMNNILGVLCATASERKIKRRVREFISISCEIHRVKRRFNDVFNTLHVVLFFGLLSDISSLYDLLKLLVIVGLDKVHMTLWSIFGVIFRIIFSKFSALQNLYLIIHIAEGLVQSERIFRRKLLMMSATDEVQDAQQQRQIDLGLMHHNIEDINTRSFKLFLVNRRFLCAFVSEIIVTYAVVTFQQFLGEYFSATGERLQCLQKSLLKD